MMSGKHTASSILPAALLSVLAVLGLRLPLSAQKAWPPLSPEEVAMKDCPQQPGAAAVWLYREMTTDQENFEITIFKRLKILTPAGRDHANIEIPYYKGRQLVEDLEARVLPPQGPPRPFTGQVFEKTAIRARRFRVSVKTFALPDVEVGSIIEFRFRIVPDYGGSSGGGSEDVLSDLQLSGGKPEEGGYPKSMQFLSFQAIHWDIQDDLFTRKAKFDYISHPLIGTLFDGPCRITWASHKLTNAQPSIKGRRVELTMENVPAFEEEEFMTSEEAEQMSVDVFFLGRQITDSNEFWRLESQNWQKAAEGFMGDTGKFAPEVRTLIADAADPKARLSRIYERAQKIRNLSYEKGMTRKRKKEQKIKSNRNAGEVLERDYGLRSDITRTFVALARAAGFEAEVVRVSTRDDKLFRINLLSFYDQMDSEAALVKLGDKSLLFDPATPFCPFGLIHWSRSNAAALRFSDKPPAFFTTAVYPPELAMTQREIALRLDLQGALSGTVKTTYTGHEALVRRLDHIHDDETDRKKALEKELTDVLPMGAVATLTKLENIDNNDPSLVAHYDISIPGISTAAGDRMLLPVSPLLGSGQYPFRHTERKYPVYFPYPFREFDDIRITLPEGLTSQARPAPLKSQNDFSEFSLRCVDEGLQQLHIQRDLVIRKSYFPVEQYAAIKSFFDSVRASDEEQIILVREKK
jgi:hypothetical protein